MNVDLILIIKLFLVILLYICLIINIITGRNINLNLKNKENETAKDDIMV